MKIYLKHLYYLLSINKNNIVVNIRCQCNFKITLNNYRNCFALSSLLKNAQQKKNIQASKQFMCVLGFPAPFVKFTTQ